MKDVMEVLREKEGQLERLGKEIKVLRVAAKIISEDGEAGSLDFSGTDIGKTEAPPASDNTHKGRWP